MGGGFSNYEKGGDVEDGGTGEDGWPSGNEEDGGTDDDGWSRLSGRGRGRWME